MTIRLGVLPYGASDSCRALRDALVAAFQSNNQVAPRMLRHENSDFRGRGSDVIVNYGNRSAPAAVFGQATVLNAQSALNNAANKTNALNLMSRAGVSTVPYTTDRATAQRWLEEGDTVYARATLNGHSGEGITVHKQGADGSVPVLPQNPLYTKAITGQRREWRVHIFKGVITYVQVKRRANGYQENPNYQEDVRNHHTGWIYATENINPSAAVLRNAAAAVAALGLDFGAVDIISRRDDAWVLEVNTAPGLTGTTLEVFTRNVTEFVSARLSGRAAAYQARFEVPAPVAPAAAPAAATARPVAPDAPRPATAVAPNVPNAGNLPFGEEVQVNRGAERAAAREDGYYMGQVQNQSGNITTRTILWSANGQLYRHGWNHPISQGSVSGLQKIGSLNVEGGHTINLDFVTQE